MANRIRTRDPYGFNKGRSSNFREGHISQNVVEIKMKTIVRKPLMIIIIKLRLRNLDS